MSGSLTLAWDERLTGYDFGPGHPLAPVRVELTIALAREFGLLDRPDVTVTAPVPADDDRARAGARRRRTSTRCARPARTAGPTAGTGSAPRTTRSSPGMHEASALVAGATLAAARAVWHGERCTR